MIYPKVIRSVLPDFDLIDVLWLVSEEYPELLPSVIAIGEEQYREFLRQLKDCSWDDRRTELVDIFWRTHAKLRQYEYDCIAYFGWVILYTELKENKLVTSQVPCDLGSCTVCADYFADGGVMKGASCA
jgi:hypothetical protein